MNDNSNLKFHLVCPDHMIEKMEGRAHFINTIVEFLQRYFEVTDVPLGIIYTDLDTFEKSNGVAFAEIDTNDTPAFYNQCCHFSGDSEGKPTIVLIESDKMDRTTDLTLYICHEFVHHLQTCDGDLLLSNHGIRWKDQMFDPNDNHYIGSDFDDFPPWEKDAYKRANLLFSIVYEHLDHIMPPPEPTLFEKVLTWIKFQAYKTLEWVHI